MKNKKKYIIEVIFISIVIVLVFILNININYKNVDNESSKKELEPLNGLAIMLETMAGTGEYKASETGTLPEKGYLFNADKSRCENGGTISFNDETKKIILKSKMSDKCYIYFDVEPHDTMIYVSGLLSSGTDRKNANIKCINGNAVYNKYYNRVEVNQINGTFTSCSLDFDDNTSKDNFATYISGLSGTIQGDGQVTEESVNLTPNYDSVEPLEQNEYKSQNFFYSSSYTAQWGSTTTDIYNFSGDMWKTSTDTMDSKYFYQFKFKVPEGGYYRMCYNLTTGNSSNKVYAFVGQTQKYFGGLNYLSVSSTSSKSGCINLGYLTTSQYIRIAQSAISSVPTLSINLKKVTSIKSVHDIRYEGKNPNNYVWFNNEYWRIIGVFDSASHGQSGKKLVKLIRSEVLGNFVWYKTQSNYWSSSPIKKILNSAYYNATDGTDSGYCYGSTSSVSNCNYSKIGIQDNYRNMIAKVRWYDGSSSSLDATAEEFYIYERKSSYEHYVGLMYMSDYGFSSPSSACTRNTLMSKYNSTCMNQNWLFGKGEEWTMTPSAMYNGHAFYLSEYGTNTSETRNGKSIRPVIFLDSSVYKIDGDGSLENPYIIGM